MCEDKISATETNTRSSTPGVLGGVEEDGATRRRREKKRASWSRSWSMSMSMSTSTYVVGERRGKGAFV